MIRAAETITVARASDPQFQMASQPSRRDPPVETLPCRASGGIVLT